MKIEIAKMERMAETGSSLLRLIQNSHTPILDLLIRESVQNSIDAADESGEPISYDISTKEFKKSRVIRHFEGIQKNLNTRYQNENQNSIVIRDSNTTGLTGPLHQDFIEDNNFGNLLKLVYEISMPQEKKGAGGSWGLGKTVYFRVGMGLVIYYSRIKLETGNYQSRLAACLVEDESKKDTLLPDQKGLKRGIAWWGQYHSKNSTKPVTDENEIKAILQDFNVQEYKDDETGTTVIIPFIDSDKLIPKYELSENLWWYSDINLFLDMALQRWYAPRIDNQFYPYGKYLKSSVNDSEITKDSMEPVYSIINTLYTAAATDKIISDQYIDEKMITIEKIELMRAFKNKVAGKVAFVKVNKETLKMGVPDNKKSPFEYLDVPKNGDNNPPIILYLRKPGMIINYETDGKWANGIESTLEEEYIIGIFVPNSDNLVTVSDANITLDEYLRQGEKADHSSWSDYMIGDRKHTIVERIQKKVAGSIRQTYNQTEKETNASRSGALSKSLANLFLPPVGFGTSPGGGSKKPGVGGSSRKKNGKLHIEKVEFGEENTLILDFSIKIPNKTLFLDIELLVESEGSKKFKGDEWEKDTELGVAFPVEVIGFNLLGKDAAIEIDFNIIKTNKFGINSKVRINTEDLEEIEGKIYIRKADPMIQSSIQENLIKEGVL